MYQGQLTYSGTRNGNTNNWDNSYKLALGNELSNDRPWTGTLYLVAIYSKDLNQNEVSQNFQAGYCCADNTVIPELECNNGDFNWTG